MKRILSLLLLLACGSVQAATYYVTNNVASGVGDGSIGNPWNWNYANWHTAPGDLVYLRGGTYTNLVGKWNDQLTFWSSGTAANPIVYTNFPGETVTLAPTSTTDPPFQVGGTDAPIGHPVEYLKFYGIHINAANIGTTSVGIPAVKLSDGAAFITIQGCEIYNTKASHGIAIAEPTHNHTIRSNIIHDIAHLQTADNTPHGIYDSNSQSNLVEYNFIYNITNHIGFSQSPSGIHRYSGSGSNSVYRYNVISNCYDGIILAGGSGHKIYGNLIRSGTFGVIGMQFFSGSSEVYNNTIIGNLSSAYGIQAGISVAGAGVSNLKLWNNIVVTNKSGVTVNSGVPANYWTNNLFADNPGGNFNDNSGGTQVTQGQLVGDVYNADLTAAPNYIPSATSSARNAGINNSTYVLDRVGTVVPQEVITDIGAGEFPASGVLPIFTISFISPIAYQQGPQAGTFIITRDDATAQRTNFFTLTGTAANGTDYTTVVLSNIFTAGVFNSTNTITPSTGTPFSGTKTVIVTISANANYTVGTPSTLQMLIQGSLASGLTFKSAQ